MSRACSVPAQRAYGKARLCRLWGVARFTHHARKAKAGGLLPPRRRGRKPVLGDEAPVGKIREVLVEAGALVFWGEGYRKVWARLRFEGILTSK